MCMVYSRLKLISIHVPRVEDDLAPLLPSPRKRISIHVPRVEDDPVGCRVIKRHRYFNPRPPCGGRPVYSATKTHKIPISIHVPRVEDDFSMLLCGLMLK